MMGKVFIIQDPAQAWPSSAPGCPGISEQPPSPQAADHHAQAGQGPGAGHTDRTEKEPEKSPQESNCNLFFGDIKEVGCSYADQYAFWWVINQRGPEMGVSGAWVTRKVQGTCCMLAAEAGVGVAIQCHLGGHQEGQQAAMGRVPGAMSQRL